MRVIVTRSLTSDQDEDWAFTLSPHPGGGGTVSVPSIQSGHPIDWPPRSAAQAKWLQEFAPERTARAGAAWDLDPADWTRLISRLDEQERTEKRG